MTHKYHIITIFILFVFIWVFFLLPSDVYSVHPSAKGKVLKVDGTPFDPSIETVPIMQMQAEKKISDEYGERNLVSGYRHKLPDENGVYYFPSTEGWNFYTEANTPVGSYEGVQYFGTMANCSSDYEGLQNSISKIGCTADQTGGIEIPVSYPIKIVESMVHTDEFGVRPNCWNCGYPESFGCGANKIFIRPLKDGYRCSYLHYESESNLNPYFSQAVLHSNGVERYADPEFTFKFQRYDQDLKKIVDVDVQETTEKKRELVNCLNAAQEKEKYGWSQAQIDEEKWQCNLSITGRFWANVGYEIESPVLFCEPVEQKTQATEEVLDTPDDIGLAENIEWSCLQAQGCTEQKSQDQSSSGDQSADNEQTGFCSPEAQKGENAPYTVIIPGIGNQMQRNSIDRSMEVWILQCFNEPVGVTGETEIICTTGSTASDERAYNAGVLQKVGRADPDNLGGTKEITSWEYLSETYGVESEQYGLFQNPEDNYISNREKITMPLNPSEETAKEIDTTTEGRTDIAEDVEWVTRFNPADGSVVPKEMQDYFFLMAFPAEGDRGGSGGEYIQRQGTLNSQTSCTLIQDPYGTVFDSYTLEPLSQANVVLLVQKRGIYQHVTQRDAPAVTRNPYITTKDGRYAFYVPNGKYKLDIKREGYTFPSIESELNSSAQLFYSDIYRGEAIIQQGQIEHRDIPLDPIDKEASRNYAEKNNIQIISLLQSVDRETDHHIIQGRTTHPKADIFVYGEKIVSKEARTTTRELVHREADDDGRFKINIPLNVLQKGEIIGKIKAMKKKIPPQTNTQSDTDTVTLSLEPILNTIQGYAMDNEGNRMENARVGVYVSMSPSALYQTQTDEDGYFQIPSQKLPPISYELHYEDTTTDTMVQIQTTEFIAQNKIYMDKENINIYAYTPTSSDKNGTVMGITDTAQTGTQSPYIIFIGGILSVLVLFSSFILGVYIYRYKSS